MIKPILIKSEITGIIDQYVDDNELVIRSNNDIPRGENTDIILIDTEAEIAEGDLSYYEMPDGWYDISIVDKTISNSDIWKGYNKIIASTNKNHNLPKLSDKSIQLFINYYNKYKCMPENVDVNIDKRMIVKIEELADYFNFDDGTRLNPNFNKIKLNKQGEVDIYIP